MLTSECWFAMHGNCSAPVFCGCLCHDSWGDTDDQWLREYRC